MAIVFWDGHLSVAPSLLSGMRLMAEAGFEVDVFIRGWGPILPPTGPPPPGVRIVDNPVVRWLSFPSAKTEGPTRLGVQLGYPLFLACGLAYAGRRRYAAIFGVDPLGGFCGRVMAFFTRAMFCYWSLELFTHPATRRERILTSWQRLACRAAALILIQDSARAAALLEVAGETRGQVLLVPNGPAGPPNPCTTDYLNRILKIPRDRMIVLHAGRLDESTLSYELAASAGSWPPSYCLVLHANQTVRSDLPEVRRLQALGGERLYLSLNPVPVGDLDELIASAHICLATYEKDMSPNGDLMAAASGKLGTYLRSGIPVICTNQKGMRELMDRYHCGVVISSVDEIPAALEAISGDYDSYRKGAFACYLREYEFSAHFGAVLDALGPADALI